jgi:hypothetical protein
MKKPGTFAKWLIGLTIPSAIGIAAIVASFLHNDKPQITAVVLPTVPPPVPHLTRVDHPARLSQIIQQEYVPVHGDKNVAGNNINANNGVLGTGIQTQGSVINAPGGIVNNGGVMTNPTVTNIGAQLPPPRVLSPVWVNGLTELAQRRPQTILILYPTGDSEAYRFSKQIADALVAGGWKLKGLSGAMFFSEDGAPLYGMRLSWKGNAVPPGSSILLDRDTPSGLLALILLQDFKEDFSVQPLPDAEADVLTLSVYANPKSKTVP